MSSISLLFLIPLLTLLSFPITSLSFTCTNPTPSPTCTSLIQYISPNSTTLSSIQSLFNLKNLRSLLGANNLPPSTLIIPPSTPISIPFPCICSNGTGISNRVPIYTVVPGDFLDRIANVVFLRLVTVDEIVSVNGIKNPSLIQIGEKIWIPLPCSCDEVSGERVVHFGVVVQAGASLGGIAAEYGTTEGVIEELNGITDPTKIQADQIIDVPLKACSSSLNNTSVDAKLVVANGTYALTANNCIKCTCSPANNYTLQCEPSQLTPLSKWTTCPSTQCGSLNLGNTTTSGCNVSTCTYAGYTNSAILTTVVTTVNATCTTGKSHASRVHLGGWSSTAALYVVHLPILLYFLQFW